MQVKFLRWVLSGVLAGMASLCLAAPPPPSPQVALVNRLYKDFSYQIIVDEPNFEGFGSGTPRPVLLKYLTPELAQLIVNDRQCEKKDQGICHLDWSPIWMGNGPGGLRASIRATHAADRVEVEIRSVQTGWDGPGKKVLYHLTKTSRGWRIRDIEYVGLNQDSLLKMLKKPL